MKIRMMCCKLLFFLVWLSFAATAAATGMVAKFGKEKPVELRDLGVHLQDNEGYTEEWSHEVWVDGGAYLGIDFGITNLGIGDHKGAVRLTHVDPDGKKTKCSAKYDDDEWKAAKKGYSLKFGKSTAQGDMQGIRLDVRCKKIAMKLEFANEAAPLKPGGGVLRYGDGDGKYSMVFSSPRSKVNGSVTVKGKTREITGVGHAAHSYTTMYPHKHVRRWFRFKALRKDISIILAEMQASHDYARVTNGWALVVGPQGRVMSSVRINYIYDGYIKDSKSKEGYAFPRRVRIVAVDGKTRLTGVLTMKDIKSIHDPTADLDSISRAFVRRFTKPMEYKLYCTYKFRIDKENGSQMIEGDGQYRFTYVNP
jgi:hypothetical protein